VSFIPLTLTALSLFIWIVITFFRGGFWQLRAFEDSTRDTAPSAWPRVVAVVPARNEAETISRCVESLVRQDYPGELRIVVVDDHSEDETGGRARAAAQRCGTSERVTILQGAALPQGWTGKLWALQQGVSAAASIAPDFFWFTDADITHAPDTLKALVARAQAEGLELASLMVLLQANTFPERLLIPAFLYFFLMLYPPKWIADVKAKTAGAAGGCILLRGEVLDKIGGLTSIRGEVIDDCALARAVKCSGGRIWMGLSRSSVSLRSYDTFSEICDLIARTAFTQLGYSTLVLLGTIAGLLLTYFVPVALTFYPQPLVWGVALAAWALMALTYLPATRFYGLSPLWAPLLPLAAMFYSYATCVSAVRFWRGSGGQWKGRAQAPVKP
jgi:hopene-associated glycosyltransferase HpnB